MTSQYVWDRLAGRDPNVRAADADRERIAERLRTSHAEGRLDLGEFQERLERCYEAKTLGQLDALVSDLPRPIERSARGASPQFRLARWRLAPLVPILLVLIVASAAAGHHVFWLWIPLMFLFWRMAWGRPRRWSSAVRRGPNDWM